MKNDLVVSSVANDHNVVTTAHLNVETIAEEMTIKKTTGFVLHATMSISLGELSATVVAKAKMETSKPTNPHLETTTAQTTVETALNKNVTDATIGSAHPVATTTSHSVQNATNVESQRQEEADEDGLVAAFQIVINEEVEILSDVAEAETEAVDSVEGVEEIPTDVILDEVVQAVTEVVVSVEAVEEILTDVVEAETEAVVLVVTETVAMTDVTLHEAVQAVTATMSVQMSVIGKLEESVQAMHITEGLNPFVLDVIKAKTETTEVKPRDSRSPLLGCA